jgi:predicted aspartyl protease
VPRFLRRALALLALTALASCGSPPPSAMELYHQDQIRQGKIAPGPSDTTPACEPTVIARLPVEVRNRLLIAPVSINGQQVRLIVDSGAERTTLSEAAAARLHLPRDMNRIHTATGIGGSVVAPDAVVSNFTLGDVTLPPVDRVAVGRFGFDDDAVPFADGLLGADVLLAFDLDIDVPDKTLTIYRVRRCLNNQPPWQEPFVALDGVTQQKDRLLIPFTLDGVPGRAVLDTGAAASTIGARMAQRLGLTDERMSLDRKIIQRGAGAGQITAHLHWFRELRVGPASVQGLMLSVMPIDVGVGDALIGEDFLEGRRVWLSFPTRQIFVSKLTHGVGGRP